MIMNIPYNIEVHDNLISLKQNIYLWAYIKSLTFYGMWVAEDAVHFEYKLSSPKNPTDWMIYQSHGRQHRLQRAPLASDETSLKKLYLPIYALWTELNSKLDNQYELTGNPEGMYTTKEIPPTVDTDLTPGWRVYINAFYNSHSGHGGQGYVHRDTPLEFNDEKTVTMLYMINPEWYPSWGGELKFYPEDPIGITSDHQQFNGDGNQNRGYNIGWLDQGRIVSHVPGRLVIYDGRCLHSTTLPGAPLEKPSLKLVFRARRK